ILVSSGANVLILDEPTNRLDIESREALEDALRAFAGAVLLVSHDRALLDAVGVRTIAIEERTLRGYAGGWAEYVREREERRGGRAAAARSQDGRGTSQAGSDAPGPEAGVRAGAAGSDGKDVSGEVEATRR